jgi:AcrR family transcriptional regulator
MAHPVKSRSTYRQAQAAATRERIAEAARRLFGVAGYGSTSIEAIAAEAGVAVRTVYSAFGTKREILSLICEQWLERARARELAGEVLAEPDPARRLRGAASWLRVLYSAGFDVVIIFEAATDESAETRELLRSKLAGRNQAMDAMIASLDGHLRAPVREVQAVYRALAAPGVYRELVEESGWTADEYERWVGDTLERYAAGDS